MRSIAELEYIITRGTDSEKDALSDDEVERYYGTSLIEMEVHHRDRAQAKAVPLRPDLSGDIMTPERQAEIDDVWLEAELRTLRTREKAQRIIASENYTGGRELSWAGMFDDAELRWLVDGLIAEGTTNFLFAQPNLGKTFTYLDLTLSMVSGLDFLGRSTTPGKVFFVLGEGKHGFMLRVLGWCKAHQIDPLSLKDSLAFYDGGNLNNDTSLDDMGKVIARVKPSIVVFDTWAATSGIADEDRSSLASTTMNRAREIAPDAALLFVHHPTKSSEETMHPIMRGSGALAGTADCIIAMYQDGDYKARDNKKRNYIAFSTEREHGGKHRHAARETVRGIYLESVSVEYGSTTGETAVLRRDESGGLSPADVFVLTHMVPGEPVTVKELVELSATHESSVKRHLKAATDVTQSKAADNRTAIYTLSKEEN